MPDILCSDCNQPAVVTETPMPLCLMHARILIPRALAKADPGDISTCLACLMSYRTAEWSRCPNDACPTNRGPSVFDQLKAEGDEPEEGWPSDVEEPRDFDPEAYFDEEGDDA